MYTKTSAFKIWKCEAVTYMYRVVRVLYPGLPTREEKAQVTGVSCLLNELVDLSANTQRYTIFNPFQFLL